MRNSSIASRGASMRAWPLGEDSDKQKMSPLAFFDGHTAMSPSPAGLRSPSRADRVRIPFTSPSEVRNVAHTENGSWAA